MPMVECGNADPAALDSWLDLQILEDIWSASIRNMVAMKI